MLSLMDGRSEVTDRVVDIAFQLPALRQLRRGLQAVPLRHGAARRAPRVPGPPRRAGPDAGEPTAPVIERVRAGNRGEGKTAAERSAWAEGLGLKDATQGRPTSSSIAGCKYSLDDEPARRRCASPVRVLQAAGADRRPPAGDRLLRRPGLRHGLPRRLRGGRLERMLEKWAAAGVTTVVTPCADCYHTFKRLYPELGSDGRGAAHARAGRPAHQGRAPHADDARRP